MPGPRTVELFQDLLAQNRGIILVTGHYGNWEIGSVFMRRVFDLPLTIVAMAEASEEVNRIRREIRDSLGTDTIEVRKSLDTALQIRRRLADNRIVAMLMDRHMGRDRVEVSLLGRRAWFLRTPALMGISPARRSCPASSSGSGGRVSACGQATPIFVSREVPRDEAIRQAAQQFADQLGRAHRGTPEPLVSLLSVLEGPGRQLRRGPATVTRPGLRAQASGLRAGATSEASARRLPRARGDAVAIGH